MAAVAVKKDVWVDLAQRRVLRRDSVVALTRQEYALLETLVTHRGRPLSRDSLLQLAWGYPCRGCAHATRTVDVHIQHLRKKLDLESEIETVYKVGYRLT